ncbi:MAG: hypothetical protein HYS25_08025 [Ignavibacteriales bacterium]|nr:hypothetical protein [Ignavibacteriales bacterium]
MRLINLITVVFLLYCSTLKAQSFIGFNYEPFMLIDEENKSIPAEYRGDNVRTYPFSLYLNYSIKLNKDFAISIRPGALITDSHYNGAEIMLLTKYYWGDKNYILGGLNVHGNYPSSTIAKGVVIPLLVLGAGFNFMKVIELEAHYELPFNKEYTWKSSSVFGPKKLNGILKLSLGFEFEL